MKRRSPNSEVIRPVRLIGEPVKRRSPNSDVIRPVRLIVTFLAPAVLLYAVFFIYPVFQSFRYSLYQGSPHSKTADFVGLGNFYRLLFDDELFWGAVWHNVVFAFVGGAATLVLSLAVAMALTSITRGRAAFRFVYLFPNVMAVVASTILWSFIFNPSFGVVNGALRNLGLGNFARAWLGEPQTTMPTLLLIFVWMQMGFYIVLFHAGLLRIPLEYLEAARIDGASRWQEFRHVTLPLLSEVTRISAIYISISGLGTFALVFLVNEGRGNKYNDVLMAYLYEQAFQNGNYGYGCAIAVVVLVLVLACTAVLNRIFSRQVVEL